VPGRRSSVAVSIRVMGVQGANRQHRLLARPTRGQLRSAAIGWEIRDAIALLAIVIIYRTRLPTLRWFATFVTVVVASSTAYIRLHIR
jgi:hypothetical protein